MKARLITSVRLVGKIVMWSTWRNRLMGVVADFGSDFTYKRYFVKI